MFFFVTDRVLPLDARPRRREVDVAEAVSELVPILGLASGMEVSRRRVSKCLTSVFRTDVDELPGTDFSFILSLLWEGLVLGTLRIEAEVLCLVRPIGRGTRLGLAEPVGVGVLLNLAMFSLVCPGGVLLTLPRGDTDFEEGILSLGIPVPCLCRRVFPVLSWLCLSLPGALITAAVALLTPSPRLMGVLPLPLGRPLVPGFSGVISAVTVFLSKGLSELVAIFDDLDATGEVASAFTALTNKGEVVSTLAALGNMGEDAALPVSGVSVPGRRTVLLRWKRTLRT